MKFLKRLFGSPDEGGPMIIGLPEGQERKLRNYLQEIKDARSDEQEDDEDDFAPLLRVLSERAGSDAIIRSIKKRQFEATDAVPGLLDLAEAGDHELSRLAIQAIGWIQSAGPEAEPVMPRLLAIFADDARPVEVRIACGVAFGGIRQQFPDAVTLLLRHKNNSSPDMRFAIACSIGYVARDTELSSEAADALTEMLTDPDENVRQAAAAGLFFVPTESAVAALCQVLRKDKNRVTRYEACRALGAIGSSAAIPALKKALRDREFLVE